MVAKQRKYLEDFSNNLKKLILEGFSIKDICNKLNLSLCHVRSRIKKFFNKSFIQLQIEFGAKPKTNKEEFMEKLNARVNEDELSKHFNLCRSEIRSEIAIHTKFVTSLSKLRNILKIPTKRKYKKRNKTTKHVKSKQCLPSKNKIILPKNILEENILKFDTLKKLSSYIGYQIV